MTGVLVLLVCITIVYFLYAIVVKIFLKDVLTEIRNKKNKSKKENKEMPNIKKLQGKEKGEKLDLVETLDWIINEMDYENFYKLARLEFVHDDPYRLFGYDYRVSKENDSPKKREAYLKYLAYKLVQNLCTPNVKVRGR